MLGFVRNALNYLRYFFGERQFVIVSGADASHYLSLVNFIRSVKAHEPQAELRIVDLGMNAAQAATIRSMVYERNFKSFDYPKYPAWMNIKNAAGHYAWKPLIIWENIGCSQIPIIWMDAGTVLRKPLRSFYAKTKTHGFFSITSSGDCAKWTHEKTLEFFRLNLDWAKNKRNLTAGAVGFDPIHQKAFELAKEWARLAQVKQAIAPQGSSRLNHRQDQSLLSILAHLHGFGPKKFIGSREFDTQQDVD